MNTFLDEAKFAHEKMGAVLAPTPLSKNQFLSTKYGCNVYLKREDLSVVRSYKLRGAYNFIRKALEKEKHGQKELSFVCASAGNHAQGFAYTCAHFGNKGTVFMPVTTPQQKIDKTRSFGGDMINIKLVGDYFDQCNTAALAFAKESDTLMVPPFDHEDIIQGQATVALEVLSQFPNTASLDYIILPVGGGGLAAGIVQIFRVLSPTTKILLVEPETSPSLKKSIKAGERINLGPISNFVDGAAVSQIGARNFEVLKNHPLENVHLVKENKLCATLFELLNLEGIVLEPAGALTIDALDDFEKETLRGKNVVCITSGGNFDFERLPEVKERALKYANLKKYFILRLPQRPGALRDLLSMFGPDDDIARFEYMKKSARNFGSILLGVETTKPENFDQLKQKMNDGGISYQDITDNDLLSDLLI